MYIKDLNALTEKWMPLVHHVINREFRWATQSTGTGSYERMRRSVDANDLAQEGWAALLSANKSFKLGHAKFKTYAYHVIKNHLTKYCVDNYSPITTPGLLQMMHSSVRATQASIAAAVNYSTYSELFGQDYRSTGPECSQTTSGATPEDLDPADIVEEAEFQEVCLQKLKNQLGEWEYSILIDRYSGMTCKDIGEKHGLTDEWIRQKLIELNFQCHHILYAEVQEHGGRHNKDRYL